MSALSLPSALRAGPLGAFSQHDILRRAKLRAASGLPHSPGACRVHACRVHACAVHACAVHCLPVRKLVEESAVVDRRDAEFAQTAFLRRLAVFKVRRDPNRLQSPMQPWRHFVFCPALRRAARFTRCSRGAHAVLTGHVACRVAKTAWVALLEQYAQGPRCTRWPEYTCLEPLRALTLK